MFRRTHSVSDWVIARVAPEAEKHCELGHKIWIGADQQHHNKHIAAKIPGPGHDVKTRAGRCSNVVSRVVEQCGLEALSLWQSLGGTQSTKDHRACRIEKCKANDIVQGLKAPSHVSTECDCASGGPDENDLERSIRSGAIPLVRLEKRDGRILVVHENFEDGMKCVAISHAYVYNFEPRFFFLREAHALHSLADGLCNTKANKLPQCQLDRIFTAAQSVVCNSRRGAFVRVWIDVLCIPPTLLGEAGVNEIAMHIMDTVMRSSQSVLVLDTDICRLQRDCSYAEAYMNITFSSWGSRLWTLYESVLARRLVFESCEGVLDLSELDKKYKMHLLSKETLLLPRLPYIELRMLASRNSTGLSVDPRRYKRLLSEAVRGRCTSHQKDDLIVCEKLKVLCESLSGSA